MSTIADTLLDKVTSLRIKYNELEKVTGEHFNIFRVLKVEKKEVRTHSAFIKELLNAKGDHDCGATFLRFFLEQQKIKFTAFPVIIDKLNCFDYNNSEAFSEEHIGYISDDGSEGGRIDIVIKDIKNNVIVIENKIDAGDQKLQLVRYSNAYPDAPIFYLTLFKQIPSAFSKKHLIEGKEFVCISYKEEIKSWLQACLKEAANLPLLRETINQYVNLINYLTKQTNQDKMEEEVVKSFLESKDSYNAAKTIRSSLNAFENRIAEYCYNEVIEQKASLYPSDLIDLFTYKDYIFKVRLSNEANHWHTDITPYKLDKGKGIFGCANDKPIKVFRELMKTHYKDTFDNKNYTVWIFSDYNFTKLNWEDYVRLDDESARKAWASKIITESEEVIAFFKGVVNKNLGDKINWI